MTKSTIDWLKDKATKGELDETERAYLDLEARQTAERILTSHKSRGGDFVERTASALREMADKMIANERAKAGMPPLNIPSHETKGPGIFGGDNE